MLREGPGEHVWAGLEARLLDLSPHCIEVGDFPHVPSRLWVQKDYTGSQGRMRGLLTTCHSPLMMAGQKALF